MDMSERQRPREIRCSCTKKLAELIQVSGSATLKWRCQRCGNFVQVTVDATSITVRDLPREDGRPTIGTIHIN
jgi:phage FluMu protein Com